MTNSNFTLGERLKKVRLNNNLTRKEFAETLGINYSYYCRIENDKYVPGIKLLRQLAPVLNLSVSYIRRLLINEDNK